MRHFNRPLGGGRFFTSLARAPITQYAVIGFLGHRIRRRRPATGRAGVAKSETCFGFQIVHMRTFWASTRTHVSVLPTRQIRTRDRISNGTHVSHLPNPWVHNTPRTEAVRHRFLVHLIHNTLKQKGYARARDGQGFCRHEAFSDRRSRISSALACHFSRVSR